jgi:hypothetical protein
MAVLYAMKVVCYPIWCFDRLGFLGVYVMSVRLIGCESHVYLLEVVAVLYLADALGLRKGSNDCNN